jgi:hypothetical protein
MAATRDSIRGGRSDLVVPFGLSTNDFGTSAFIDIDAAEALTGDATMDA